MPTLLDALGLHSPALFALTVLVLNATPGVDLLFVAGRALAGGWRPGLAAVAGISAGCVVHALLAAFGLAAVLAVSPWAFVALKLAGAAYLLWLGLGMLRSAWRPAPSTTPRAASPTGWAQVARQGLLTNVLNPKVALFFLAFLPQFIQPQAPHKTLAFVALGAWFVVQSAVFLLALVLGLVAVKTALARRLQGPGRVAGLGRWLNGLGGVLFLGLAARLALADAKA